MSHFLDRLTYFTRPRESFSNGHGIKTIEDRKWEDAYRNRWRHDKVVRSTHGVNCTGGCSWQIFVKNGLVSFEMQQTDYPRTRDDLPNHEPRGCQRGASFSWYLYSPHRIKHPMIRGRLLDLYRAERKSGKDPVEAWAAIQADSNKRDKYVKVRGLGGFVRTSWDEVLEITAAANIHTIQKWGPDRIYGFSPIPAMSMISYAAGSRYMSLIGGACGSFYDWYCDLPIGSPQTWGEQTDVPESADWYNSTYIIIAGANLPMTRTPDAHFAIETRYKGTKIVSMAPDYAEYVKFADLWMPVRQGTDSAAFMAMGHVALKEFYIKQQTPYFQEYTRKYTDLPMQVVLRKQGDTYVSDRNLRASDFANNLGEANNPEWKTIGWDEKSKQFVAPNGSIGFRWGEEGKWNLLEKSAGSDTQLELSCQGKPDVEIVPVSFPHFTQGEPELLARNVPARRIKLSDGNDAYVSSVFDLLVAQYGVDRGLGGANVSSSYEDADCAYTPAWAEKVTGVKRADIERTGREFADNAAKTKGKSMVIMGAAINHWYHHDQTYRSIMNLLHLCGCVGKSGGGWAHYVGQEKLRPQAGWAPIAFALDWQRPPRHQNSTSYWYFHTDQWRYESVKADDLLSPAGKNRNKGYSLADYNVAATRLGWLPSAPHFNQNPLDLAAAAAKAGATDEAAVGKYVAEQLKSGELDVAYADPDNPVNWPRNLIVWRANLIGTSAKGHEYFLKHLLGAQNAVLQESGDGNDCKEVKWVEDAPVGKLDLMVDINFRLNSTGAYSDIILPTATWYEKNDLNTSDMHPFIHPLSTAVDPCWQSRSDWEIYKGFARTFSALCEGHLGVEHDVVLTPQMHDTPAELAQPKAVREWYKGDCDLVPGVTAPGISVVERDYPNVYKRFTALGPLMEKLGNGGKGIGWNTETEVTQLGSLNGQVRDEGVSQGLAKIETDIDAAEVILQLAPETNGHVAVKAWEALSKITGRDHAHLALHREDEKIRYRDVQAQPRKIISSPTWSGLESEKVSYNAGYTNVHELIPWRTLTGRQQFYQDHPWMQAFGEGFSSYRPPVDMKATGAIHNQRSNGNPEILLNFITPHQKWGIHSTYTDNLHMLTLSRGGPIIWLSEDDAREIGVEDNDWVELFNINGAIAARAVVSQRVNPGMTMMYHAQEKTINTPGAEITGVRGGIHNSVTRIVLKPTHMIGGYAQLSYGFNYYGTIGTNRDEFVVVRKMNKVDWLDTPVAAEKIRPTQAHGETL